MRRFASVRSPRSGSAPLLVATALCVTLCACGKKGPPLPPLNLVPDRPAETAGRVAGDTVYLSMTVPARNANGGGTPVLDHLEIYAVTVDAGAIAPPNRDLLANAHAIVQIPIQPPVDPDAEQPEESSDDTRPKAGDRIVFAEHLTEAQTTPQVKALPAKAKQPSSAPSASGESGQPAVTGALSTPTVPPLTSPESVPATGSGAALVGVPSALPVTPAVEEPTAAEAAGVPTTAGAPTAGAATQAAAAAPAPASTVTRVYLVRGMTKKGRAGTPSARLVVPIVPPPPPPTAVTADFSETSVTVAWKAPEDTGAVAHAPMTYNVYPQPASAPPAAPTTSGVVSVPSPLNAQPLDTLSLEHAGAEPGKEQCFVVTTVEIVASIPIESAPSAPACVTPVDRFAPAAPAGLAVVGTTGAMNLIWDANHEPDVAGYVVLRGEAPGDTLQPLTPEPIRETRFHDTTARPGVRYAYAIVAVDRAGNRSAPSSRVEETAR